MGWIVGAIGGFIGSLFTDLFSVLNYFIYSFIEDVYGFLMNLTDIQVFDSQTLKAFSTRIYAILGIFMAFKLIFTFITYAVTPDNLTDKSKGGMKIVVNIIVSLVLLIAVPNLIFPLSRELQTAILNDHILEQVILGVKTSSNAQNGAMVIDTKQAGRYLSFSVLNGFFRPNPALKSNSGSCANTTMILDESVDPDPSKQQGLENALYKMDGDCATAILELVDNNPGDAVYQYETAYSQKSISMLLGGEDSTNLKQIETNTGDNVFKFNYVISLAAGIVTLALLLHFCVDIAVRTIKLGFLELIAPIPILSYIDANSKKTFDSWMKECMKTYVDLFVRLAALYFAIFLITSLWTGSGVTYSSTGQPVGGLEKVAIILGALVFANQVPELIGSMLGIKLGNFSLNPFKGSALASGILGGAIGGLGGVAAGLKAGTQAGAPVRGAFSGLFSGMGTGYKTKFGSGSLRQSMDKSYQNLTGNHYEHMSPGRLLMSYKGQSKVDAIKTPLNEAYDQLRQRQTALNVASNTSSQLSNSLRQSGIDVSDLNQARNTVSQNNTNARNRRSAAETARNAAQEALADVQTRRSAAEATMQSIQNRYNEARQIIERTESLNVPDHLNPYIQDNSYAEAQAYLREYQGRYDAAQAELDQYDISAVQAALDNATSEFEAAEQAYQLSQNQMTELSRYEASITRENELREQISEVERNISTLKDEKKQREKFYNIDPSPKDSVNKAIQNINSRTMPGRDDR